MEKSCTFATETTTKPNPSNIPKIMKAQVENKKLRTCFWLVNLLHMHKEGLKLSEINRKYMEEIDISQGVPFIKTTFQNYKNAIQDLLGIEIS